MLALLNQRWISLILLLLGLLSLSLFMYGFFPLKYHSGKLAHLDDLPNFIDGVSIDGHEVYNSGDNAVILMVIDGLRYDFVSEEYMPFTAELLKNKSACIHVTVADPPTVTMPRIKAMMTGTVSTFADVALNFGAPAVRGDSVPRAAFAQGKRNVMYGDDTWLRLFPGMWTEADGTTSFYVTDYTEVDQNVTRHLPEILKSDKDNKTKFDFLVLHYLGLDHIGHLEGARSPKIKVKLKEMDLIVSSIFKSMKAWDREAVLMICGDHGMRDAGGHGGASPAEVLVPLVVAKAHDFTCPHPPGPGPTVAQVDVAPTVAWLLHTPLPAESTGRILPALLPADIRQHLYLLHVVAAHNAELPVIPKDKEFYKQFRRAEKQFAHYLATGQQSAAKIAKEFYEESLEEMAKYLMDTSVDFDGFAIVTAILLLYFIAAALLTIVLYSLQPESDRKISVTRLHHHRGPKSKVASFVAFALIFAISFGFLTIACFISETKSNVCSYHPEWLFVITLISITLTMVYFIVKTGVGKTRNLKVLKDLNIVDYLLVGGTLFHAWSFFGTSFIEEEHMTWYFLWNTLMFFILVRTVVVLVVYVSKLLAGATEVQDKPHLQERMVTKLHVLPKWIALIALHRYLRTMNQTGDRWLFLPDTADWLNAPENNFFLNVQFLIGLLATVAICISNAKYMNNLMEIHSSFTILMAICIVVYKVATAAIYQFDPGFEKIRKLDNVIIVQIFWGLLIAQVSFEILTYVGGIKSCGLEKKIMNAFTYKHPKAKTEDMLYDAMVEEPWDLEDVKLKLARSLTYLMLNYLMLIVILLMRPHNTIMVPSIYLTCVLTSTCLDHKLLDKRPGRNTEAVDVFSQTLVHLWIGSLFFFYQGNSNSLASVDLGAGYVGLRDYSPGAVAFRMGLHAYAGPAIAGAALFALLSSSSDSWPQYLDSIWRASNIFAFHRVYSLAVYCLVAAVFKDHLFVWTVFSPKILYDFVATIFTLQALMTVALIVATTHVMSRVAKIVAYKMRL